MRKNKNTQKDDVKESQKAQGILYVHPTNSGMHECVYEDYRNWVI